MLGLLIICIVLIIGFFTGVFSRVPNQKTIVGKVVSIEHKYDTGEKKPTYVAIVEYCVGKQFYHVKSKYKSSSFYVGQRLKVRYNALNPSQSQVAPEKSIYLIMVVLFITGSIIFYRSFN